MLVAIGVMGVFTAMAIVLPAILRLSYHAMGKQTLPLFWIIGAILAGTNLVLLAIGVREVVVFIHRKVFQVDSIAAVLGLIVSLGTISVLLLTL